MAQKMERDTGVCCTQDASPQPDPPPLNLSSEFTFQSRSGRTAKSLNVPAVAIGVTGAVLLLIVCGAIIFYLRKRRRKAKLPPSAEFANVATVWHPRAYHESFSPTTSTFTPKDARSFASSPFEPLRYNVPCPPAPITPSYLP